MTNKRNNKTPRRGSRHRARSLLCLTLLSALFVGALSSGNPALTVTSRAADSQENMAYCEHDRDKPIYYGGEYLTYRYTIGGNTGYCVQPTANSPENKSYEKHYDIENWVDSATGEPEDREKRAEVVRKVLWGCYGSPGFDKSVWPSKWYDQTEMNDDKYYAASHILLANAYWKDLDIALHGCDPEFVEWYINNISGWNGTEHVYDESTFDKLTSHVTVPSRFHVYVLYTGEDSQNMLGWEYDDEPNYVYVKKTAGDQGLTGGTHYSLAGATYSLYTDRECSNPAVDAEGKAAVLTTGKNGESEKLEMPEGTYYVQETAASPGFDLDTNIYRITVEEENTIDNPALVSSVEPARYALIEIQKSSGMENITAGIPCYTLKDAEYGIYTDADCSRLADRVTTDDSGHGISGRLPFGTYYVKEIKRPSGYRLNDTTVYGPITVSPSSDTGDTTVRRDMSDRPLFDGVGISIYKTDLDTGAASPEGGASLEDARFTVKYYAGHLEENALEGVVPTRSWVIRTIERDGGYVAELTEECKVSGGDFYLDESGQPVLPLGTYTITETGAPEGYMLEGTFCDEEERTVNAGEIYYTQLVDSGSDRGSGIWICGGNVYSQSDAVIRGGVKVQKRDLGSGRPEAEGNATFAGTVFEIINDNDQPVLVCEDLFQPGEVVMTLVADENGYAQTDPDVLPYGSYRLVEAEAPTGNLLGSIVLPATVSLDFCIEEEGVIVDLTGEDLSVTDQVKRGDVTFQKQDGENQAVMGSVQFKLTSMTTGESHLLWTDENGDYSTASGWIPHTQGTNAGESWEDGIWFYGYSDAEGSGVSVEDGLGALPYDTYLLEELPCEANEGRVLITTEFTVYRDVTEVGELWGDVNLGTLDNYAVTVDTPEIGTTLTDLTSGEHQAVIPENGDVILIDRVAYRGLEPGNTYVIRGILMDRETGEALADAEGNKVTGESEPFTTFAGNGTVEVTFSFCANGINATDAVAFEYLYETDEDMLAAQHTDLNCESQTVTLLYPDEEEPSIVPAADTKTTHTPRTGDAHTIAWLIVVIAAAAGAILGIAARKRKYYDD